MEGESDGIDGIWQLCQNKRTTKKQPDKRPEVSISPNHRPFRQSQRLIRRSQKWMKVKLVEGDGANNNNMF